MSTTALEPPFSLRRRTNPLETAHREAMSKTPSRLPSPPEDNDASSDDTVMPQGRHHSGGDVVDHFSAGSGVVGSDRKHEFPSISSRLHPSTPSHSQSPSTIRTRSRSSSSDSDSDSGGLTDAAHTIASSTSWSDLPLLVTLVPPMVALFTGGDYLRDILLTCFLVWYLHQIIKIPWDIYLASLPPPRTSHQPTQHKELRTTRIAALLLCAVTPFLGATLLRLAASYLYPSDPEPLSWFSTALFVLAAGVRPWRHLAHLVLTRTEALHLAAHKPSTFRAALLAPEIEHRERARDAQRIDSLESELAQLRAEFSVLTERTRSATKQVKALEQALSKKVETVQGRVEVLERYGSSAGGTVGGWELIWRGFGKLVCAAFPFTKSWFEEAEAEAGRGRRVKGKKGKRLRGVVNNLPPVPELDEHEGKLHGGRPGGATDVRPNGLDETRRTNSDSGVLPSLPKPDGFIMWTINLATWPLRVMRGILTGFVGIFRS